MTILDPVQPAPGANMKSVGTNTSDGEGLTLVLAASEDQLFFMGSINRSELEKLAPAKKEKAQVFLEAVKVLLAAAHRGGCDIDCKLGLTLTIHEFPIHFETAVRTFDLLEQNKLLESYREQMKQMGYNQQGA